MKLLILTLAFLLPQQKEDVDKLVEKANTALNNAEVKVLKIKPDDKPEVEKCPCNGKGYIVHGDGHRTPCPGTTNGPCEFNGVSGSSLGYEVSSIDMEKMLITINGKEYLLVDPLETKAEVEEVKPETKEPEKASSEPNAIVEIHTAQPNNPEDPNSSSWCIPCDNFKRDPGTIAYIKSLEDNGWEVQKLYYERDGFLAGSDKNDLNNRMTQGVPHFKVKVNGKYLSTNMNGKNVDKFPVYIMEGNVVKPLFSGSFFSQLLR